MPLNIYGNDSGVQALFDARAVGFKRGRAIRFKQGVLSPGAYIDNRILPSIPEEWAIVKQSMLDQAIALRREFDVIVGVATGGIAHGVVLAHELELPYMSVRSTEKHHGLSGLIDGDLEVLSGARVLLVEDMSSTFGSSLNAMQALVDEEKQRNRVTHTLLINTWNLPDFQKNTEDHSVHAMCTGETIVNVAARQGMIDKEYEGILRHWLEHPEDESWSQDGTWTLPKPKAD